MDYVFDVDGTLTDSGKPINPEFAAWFAAFINHSKIFGDRIIIVTGEDWLKSLYCLGQEILYSADLVCNNLGNVIRKKDEIVSESKFKLETDLLNFTNELLELSPFESRRGENVVITKYHMRLVVPGTSADESIRKKYIDYDSASGEREHFCKLIESEFDNLCAVKGGETTIDIVNRGRGKEQIADIVTDPCKFFGDDMDPYGNDYDLAHKLYLRNRNHNEVFSVKSWRDTWEILRDFSNVKVTGRYTSPTKF